MKSLKYITLLGVLCAGITSLAHATLTLVGDNVTIKNSGDATELAAFIAAGGDSDATNCLKTDSFGTFGNITVSDNGDGTITVDFDLSNTSHQICGFIVKDGVGTQGGGNVVNIYTVTDNEGVSGSFVLQVPGKNAAFSHLTVFCCPGGGVPDSGTTAMLLGGALTGLGVVRRYLKR
jgi:VPDSG-CTERM motif